MSEGPWIRFFPSDWLAGTRGMTAAETGIYITLVAMMYERGGSIKYEPARLTRLCGASNSGFKWAIDSLISEGKIHLADGYLSNCRVVDELSYSREKKALAREAANTRWHKNSNKNNDTYDADAMRTHSARNANQKPEPEIKKDEAIASSKEKLPTTKGTRLSKAWKPSFDPFEFGADLSLATAEVTDQLQRFRDYWQSKPGQAGTKLDWDATLRNWLRKASDDRRSRAPPTNGHGRETAWQRQMRAFEELDDEITKSASLERTVPSLSKPGAN